MIELPLKPIPASLVDPKNLILFGLPKCGKTTILSTLPDCLIIDTEKGSGYVDAMKVEVNTLEELQELCRAIKEANCPYKFIAIDTISKLEEMCAPLALKRYVKDHPDYTGTLLDIPFGAGYALMREAIFDVINLVSKVTPNVILVGHVKDKTISNIDNTGESTVKDLALTGQLPKILAANSDAIGLVFRDLEGNLCIDFNNNGSVISGARPKHLAGKDFVISEKQKDGTFVSRWERIYPSLKK